MTNANQFECRLNSGSLQEDTITNPVQVAATPVPGSEDLHVISDKCLGCLVAYLPTGQPRVISAMGSEIWRCKSTDDCYLDEQLAIASVLGLSMSTLIEEVYSNELRRAQSMGHEYFEPKTLSALREQEQYPHPNLEETIAQRLRRHSNPKPNSSPPEIP